MAQKTLISEQLPNDGSYQLVKMLRVSNVRLSKLGKRGKRATLKKSGSNLAAQFSFEGRQQQKGLNLRFNRKGIEEGEKLAAMITNQLVANQFTWDWFDSLLGKQKPVEEEKALTCHEMIEQYKAFYFKENADLKDTRRSWYNTSRWLEKALLHKKTAFSLNDVREVIEEANNNTHIRTYAINGLISFLHYFGIQEFDSIIERYKKNNKPKQKGKYVPSDAEVLDIYENGFTPKLNSTKKYLHRLEQWRFLYALLAIYGLRIHEAWNIANWDKPVTFKDGDWVVSLDEDGKHSEQLFTSKPFTVPAVLDSNNGKHLLCIKHETKTGYRVVMPISPEGHDWFEEFDLLRLLNLPDIEKPLLRDEKGGGGFRCTHYTCQWFRNRKYGFTPHALRHAYNHRAHNLGYNPKDIANSLGHTLTTNQSTYLKHESVDEKYRTLSEASAKNQEKQSRIDRLTTENRELKAEVGRLKSENERLKTELKMHRVIFDKSQ